MKRLVNKLVTFGFLGLFTLSSCSTFQKKISSQKEYDDWMILRYFDNKIILAYDTDNDGFEDLRKIFTVKDVYSNGALYFELISIGEDLNRDGFFTEDEYKIITKDNSLDTKLKEYQEKIEPPIEKEPKKIEPSQGKIKI